MPVPNGFQSLISDSLKKSLSHSKKDSGDVSVGQAVASSAKRSLLEKAEIKFVKAEKDANSMLQNLKDKYICLNRSSANSATDKGKDANKERHKDDGIAKPKVVLFPADKVKLTWENPRRVGAGLSNLGNTCFLNSVLQCLSYTPPLANHLGSGVHKSQCRSSGFCMLCELQNHVNKSLMQSGGALKPMGILQKLKLIAKHMRWGRQEDAHEFLRYVVDAMQKSCLNGQSNSLEKLSKETTLVHQVFGGYLRSQVRCLQCKTTSNTYDTVLDISVDLKGVNTVEKALQKFVQPETLDIDNAYKCLRCKKKVRALKQFTIHRAPKILTVHLKRFDYHRLMGGKVSRHIEFSHKLNIRSFMSNRQGEPVNYHLYGVLVHSGYSCNSGHYYCYIKAPNQTWYCMNDSHVSQTGLNSVLKAEAYILFYALSPTKHPSPQKPLTSTASSMISGRVPTSLTPSNKTAAVNGQVVRKTPSGPTLLKTPFSLSKTHSSDKKNTLTDLKTPQGGTPSSQPRRISLTAVSDTSHTSAGMPSVSHSCTSSTPKPVLNGSVEHTRKHKLKSAESLEHSASKKAKIDPKSTDVRNGENSKQKEMLPLSVKPTTPVTTNKFKAMSPPDRSKAMSPPSKPKATSPLPKAKAMSPPKSSKVMAPLNKLVIPPPVVTATNSNWLVSPGRTRNNSGSESCNSINSTSEWQVSTTPKKATTHTTSSIQSDGKQHLKRKQVSGDSGTSVNGSTSEHAPKKKLKASDSVSDVSSSTATKAKGDGPDVKRQNETTPLPLVPDSAETTSSIANHVDSITKKKKKKKKKKHNDSLLTNEDAANKLEVLKKSSQVNGGECKEKSLRVANGSGDGKHIVSNTSTQDITPNQTDSSQTSGKKKKKKKKIKQEKAADMSNGDVMMNGTLTESEVTVSCLNMTGKTSDSIIENGKSDLKIKKKKKKQKQRETTPEVNDENVGTVMVNGIDGNQPVGKSGWKEELKQTLELGNKKLLAAKAKMMKKRRYSEPVVKVWDEKVEEDNPAFKRQVNQQPMSVWDGRKDGNISFILERHASIKGLGSGVSTWEGGKSEINLEVERERLTANYQNGWYDGYEQEIDEGKRKKVKVKNAQKHKGNQQHFQSIQNNTNVVQQLRKEGKLPSLSSY